MIDLLTHSPQYPRAAAPTPSDAAGRPAHGPRIAGHERPTDTVELSEASRKFEQAATAESDAKVARIKAMIADDSYLTDDKIDAVVNKLHAALCQPQAKKRLA